MAIGIVAISVLTVVGLLPHGLEVSRQTADIAYKTRIFQQIASEYQAMPWNVATGDASRSIRREFDYQGAAVRAGVESVPTYIAEAEVVDGAVTLPTTGGGLANDNLRRLVVRIATSSDPRFTFNDSVKSKLVSVYSTLLARSN